MPNDIDPRLLAFMLQQLRHGGNLQGNPAPPEDQILKMLDARQAARYGSATPEQQELAAHFVDAERDGAALDDAQWRVRRREPKVPKFGDGPRPTAPKRR